MTYDRGDEVHHSQFGTGRVVGDDGATVVVRFPHGLEECIKTDLERRFTVLQGLDRTTWDIPLAVTARVQAEAITSVNDVWGVFSRSSIALLPHQLWVCKKVSETWPARWMIADDVGLGKTIEAGLILMPLLSRGRVRRLLVLCPASLVEQWQRRLFEMFDIRLTLYDADQDRARSRFWEMHNQVVASFHTLRDDRGGRHGRLFAADPWDMVIVDEAHHLNNDEGAGPTLGYKLLRRMVEERRADSVLFFTGTPHRGKSFNFLALLQLLQPEVFSVKRPLAEQLNALPQVLIRNNKQSVTDLHGQRLFLAPSVRRQTYSYSPDEAHFYETLTGFIASGRAWASKLGNRDGRAVMLVLIAMQKLASSSVAAIRRALRRRLERVREGQESLDRLTSQIEGLDYGDEDERSRLEEKIVEVSGQLALMQDEEPHLRELLVAADRVHDETKVQAVLELLRTTFKDRQVVMFTEYKATQSLILSALNRAFGDGCCGFINGEDRAEDVKDSHGRVVTLQARREATADAFNSGQIRYLVCTEAGGEGIDLQERCHSLIHIDLPWNPMRMHQRVGRLYRYGQQQRVDVLVLHNPETVESRIWEKLEEKIREISLAMRHAMEDPEDLHPLVLGMASPGYFETLFWEGHAVAEPSPGGPGREQRLVDWFDGATSSLGGQDVVAAVQDLVGNCARFDFQQVGKDLPQVDLPALRPFLVTCLALHGRRPTEDKTAGGLSFITPDKWKSEPGVRARYEGMIFDRKAKGNDARSRILGVGHKLVDLALADAKNLSTNVCSLPASLLPASLVAFEIHDKVTDGKGSVKRVVVGVELASKRAATRLLRDWELLERLSALGTTRQAMLEPSRATSDRAQVTLGVEAARTAVLEAMPELGLPFRLPEAALLGVLWVDR